MYIRKSMKKNLEFMFVKIYIYTTFNNTIITVTNASGNVVTWVSSGCCKFKGSRKSTPHAASSVAKKTLEKLLLMLKNNVSKQIQSSIFVKGPGSGAESAIRVLNSFFIIKSISNITGIPHNGCRPKKMRRV